MKIDFEKESNVLTDIGGHYIKLRGYNRGYNPSMEYSVAKRPISFDWRRRGVQRRIVIKNWMAEGGWIGWNPPKGIIIVDVDHSETAEILSPHYQTMKIKTPRGMQFIFKGDDETVPSSAGKMTKLGIRVDFRTEKGMIVVPTENTEGREFISTNKILPFPNEFYILENCNLPSILPLVKGQRNDYMSKLAASHARHKLSREESLDVLGKLNKMIDPLSDKELQDMVRGAQGKFGKPNETPDGEELPEDREQWISSSKKGYLFKYPIKLLNHLINNHHLLKPDLVPDFYIFQQRAFKKIDKADVSELILSHLLEDKTPLPWLDTAFKSFDFSPIKLSDFGKHVNMICTNNGTWMIGDSIDLVEDSPDHMIMNHIPYDLDMEKSCPVWNDNLDLILPDPRSQMVLQEILGYLLVPDNSAKKIFVLYGKKDTGKTLVSKVMTRLLGEDNISHIPMDELSSRFASSNLVGKIANIVDDQDATYLKKSGFIKSMTGDGKVRGEIKGGKTFYFWNKARLVFTCNEVPRSADKDDSWSGRHLIIPFDVQIPPERIDRKIMEKFDFEGILAWAVQGLQRILANKMEFTVSEIVSKTNSEYVKSNDSFLEFIDSCCKLEGRENFQNLLQAYRNFSENKLRPSRLKDRLNKKGFVISGDDVIGISLDPSKDIFYDLTIDMG